MRISLPFSNDNFIKIHRYNKSTYKCLIPLDVKILSCYTCVIFVEYTNIYEHNTFALIYFDKEDLFALLSNARVCNTQIKTLYQISKLLQSCPKVFFRLTISFCFLNNVYRCFYQMFSELPPLLEIRSREKGKNLIKK